jgi:hypothetical protein
MKTVKLCTVLLIAVMILVLGLLVASVSGCAGSSGSIHSAVQQAPTATALPDANGTFSRPLNVDAPPGASEEMWMVTSDIGTHPWSISSVYVEYPIFKVGNYILHDQGEYRIFKLDVHQLKMTVELMDRETGLSNGA